LNVDPLTLGWGSGFFFGVAVCGLGMSRMCRGLGLLLRFFGRSLDRFAGRLMLHRWRRWTVGNGRNAHRSPLLISA
jgi:hypothetical protein